MSMKQKKYDGSITDVEGILLGHYTDEINRTGCSVVICEKGAVTGVAVRGSAPGTRELACLDPKNTIDKVHAILLSGGSAFGLDSAGGVMQYLSEKKIGIFTGDAFIPIVPAAILYDLGIGNPEIRPTKENGYAACQNAAAITVQGRVGAGSGATIGKSFGKDYIMESGIGSASIALRNNLVVGAVTAVNAIGDIKNDKGNIIAGAQKDGVFMDTAQSIIKNGFGGAPIGTNTTIGVLATNAKLNKAQVNKLASICHDGLARAIHPCHTSFDGDTYFAMSTNEVEGDFMTICTAAVECVFRSIINAVTVE